MRPSPPTANGAALIAFAAFLAGCGGTLPGLPASALSGTRASAMAPFVLSRFGPSAVKVQILNTIDGYPQADLLYVNGAFYGTTLSGGTHSRGTVFKITKTGKVSILHDFGSGKDAENPTAPLIDVNGTLYGTSAAGGSGTCMGSSYSGCGTVFKITTSGVEKVLYSFKGGSDGQAPRGALLDINGTLYGTTVIGGASSSGTVFKIKASGTESVLYSFKGGNDGTQPYAGLINVSGTLYGVTYGGGVNSSGTIFKITTSGTETVVYPFLGYYHGDGEGPWASLTNVKGTLYGTTLYGGTIGYGCVFKVTRSGTESVLHSFGAGEKYDGARPLGTLTYLNGSLYGTTYEGGKTSNGGTIFKITTSGTESVLYSFGQGTKPGEPYAGMIYVAHKFYGTTEYAGSVFAMTL